ncbi:iron chelate uptake ABC transporter family permease subunit [Vibrio lentus]|nr:iron chelate uptake ABC transporter family permease subunit [Vibrio lentus]
MIGVAEVSFSDFFNGNNTPIPFMLLVGYLPTVRDRACWAGLSVSGLIMQQDCFRISLAAPSTLGTISCAMLGYIVGILVLGNAAQWSYLGFIFAFAVLGTMLLVRFLQHLRSSRMRCWCL